MRGSQTGVQAAAMGTCTWWQSLRSKNDKSWFEKGLQGREKGISKYPGRLRLAHAMKAPLSDLLYGARAPPLRSGRRVDRGVVGRSTATRSTRQVVRDHGANPRPPAVCDAEDVYLEDGALVLRSRRSDGRGGGATSRPAGLDARQGAWGHAPRSGCVAAALPGGGGGGRGRGVWPARGSCPRTRVATPTRAGRRARDGLGRRPRRHDVPLANDDPASCSCPTATSR